MMGRRPVALALLTCSFACTQAQVETAVAGLACLDLNDVAAGRPREIRMVALYTQSAAAAAAVVGNNIENEIELAFVEMNDVFQQSGIPIQAVLTHMEQVTVAEPRPDSDILNELIDGIGSLAVARTLRIEHHADVVALVTISSGGMTRHMLAPSMAARDRAFLIAGRYPMGQQFTLAHELGHLLGGVDGRPSDPAKLPRYRYAFSSHCLTCVVDGVTGWHTIMGTPLSSGGVTTTRIQRFSNPELQYFGTTTGSSTDPFADNRETLLYTATLVSAFQYTPVWFAALGAEGPWFETKVDTRMMSDILIGDFDGDRQADALKVDGTTNTWYVSFRAMDQWKEVFVDPRKVPLSDLRVGDFDANGVSEVFSVDLTGQKWLVWKGGTDWEVLNATAAAGAGVAIRQMAFGNITGDRGTDVFWSDVGATTPTWKVSSGGTTDWSPLQADASLKIDTEHLRLADFDRDGIADVFRSDVSKQSWLWSKSGTAPWATLNGPNAELAVEADALAIGDFNGDGEADVLRPNGVAWGVAMSGKGALQLIKLSCTRIDNMALGDFDGDGSTDVLRAGIRP